MINNGLPCDDDRLFGPRLPDVMCPHVHAQGEVGFPQHALVLVEGLAQGHHGPWRVAKVRALQKTRHLLAQDDSAWHGRMKISVL